MLKKNISYLIPIILLLYVTNIKADPRLYISPGFSVAWGKKTVVVGWKISLGKHYDLIENNIDGYFVNCTIGMSYGPDNPVYTYLYTEIESGIQTVALFSGAGLGLAFVNFDGGTMHVLPKAALFTGCINFIRSDFIVYKKKLIADLGGSVVIPLGK